MIFYLTTSQISFAPLTSRGGSRERSEEDHKKCLPPKPSAKSMYRLADKVRVYKFFYVFYVFLTNLNSLDWTIYASFP